MKNIFSKKLIKDALLVNLGTFLLAFSITSFLLPNKIVVGGINGLGIVLHHVFSWNLVAILYSINIPLLLLCFLLLGKEVLIKTIYASMIYPIFMEITKFIPILTKNPFFAACLGGIICGVGLGFVFKGNASTGGTAIISQIIHKYLKVSLGLAMILVDGSVVLSAFLILDSTVIVYSLISLFLVSQSVNKVQKLLDKFI